MREKIKNIMMGVFKLEMVPDDISMSNCDKWDSLCHLILIAELESEFNISIDPESIAVIRSLQEIEVLITKLTKQ